MFNIFNGEVFITGATGFIGRHVVQSLMNRHVKINILCRNIDKAKSLFFNSKNLKFISYDINSHENILGLSSNDCLIHCAWSDLADILSVSHTEKQFKSHCDFLHVAIKQGIGKIIVTGSFSEYGLQQGSVDYSTPTSPVTAYGVAKDGLHKFLRELKNEYDFELIWLRLFHVYAQNNNQRGLFADIERAVMCKQTSFDMSSGDQILDYSDVETVALSIVKSIFLNDGVYTVCSGHPLPLKDIVKQWLHLNQYKIALNFGTKDQRAYNSSAIWGGDASRLHKMARRQNHD